MGTQPPELISFDRRDREILEEILKGGGDSELISNALEIALSTINARISAMCERCRVARRELIIWILQNPNCLTQGAVSQPGLHKQPCDCGSTYCLGMIALKLKRATL